VNENTRRGVSKEAIEKEKEGIYSAATEAAKDRVKAAYLFSRIAEKEAIEVSEQDLLARATLMAKNMKVTPQKLIQDMKKNKTLSDFEQQLLNEKVITFLVENASVEDVPVAAAPPAP
jgi:FKBP-type peptidyl-prolyl cis-trans isomerase (trigger factor)